MKRSVLWRFGLLTLALLSTGCAQAALAAILSTGGGGGSGGGSSTASGAPAPGAPAPAAPAGVTQVPVTLSQTTASAAGGDVIRIKLEGVESTAAAAQLPDDTVAPGATGAPLVKVLGEIVTARYVDATTIEFVLPALTIGNHTRQIGIEIEAGRYRGFSRFTYTAFPPACEGFDPPRARPGDEVTVKGKGFVPGCRVFFGNLEAHVTYLGPTRLKARVPALGLGHYECRVVHPEGPESDDDDAESGDDEDDFQRSPPLYSLTLTRATPVARGLSFPVEAHLTADGGVSPVESSLELSVLRADSSVAYVSSKVTSSNRATWNLNLSEVGTYTLRISGYWGYQPSILEQQVTIVPRFRVLELPSTPAQVGQLSPLKVAIWGVGEPDSTATGQVDVRLVGCEQGSLAGTTSRPLEAGEASFVDLGLERPGRYTLRITQGSDQQDHVQTMEIGPAVGLRFLTPAPSQAEAGAPLAPALEVALVDALNNVVESASEVELSLDANPAGASLSGGTTRQLRRGIALFEDVTVSDPSTDLTLRARCAGVADATLSLDVLGPPLKVLSATAYEGATESEGIDSDDSIVIVFDQPTNKPAITAANVDQVLFASVYTFVTDAYADVGMGAISSWKSGDGSFGGATWSADGKTLTVHFSTSGGAPTVHVNNRILVSAAVKALGGGQVRERVMILGRLGSAPKVRVLDPYIHTAGQEITVFGENFSAVPSENTVRFVDAPSGQQFATVLEASENHLKIRAAGVRGDLIVTVAGKSDARFTLANPYVLPSWYVSRAAVALAAPRVVSTARDSTLAAFVDGNGRAIHWGRGGGHAHNLTPSNSAAQVDAGNGGWVAIQTLPSPHTSLRGDAIYVSRWVHNDNIAPDKELVSIDAAGDPLGMACRDPVIDGSGRYVAFVVDTLPPELESQRAGPYVLVRDRQEATLSLASRDRAGNAVSGFAPELSPDGRYFVFISNDDLLESNGRQDGYLRDRQTGALVWLTPDDGTGPLTSRVFLAENGRVATYARGGDVYVFDRLSGQATLTVSQAEQPSLSGDGKQLFFVSARADLVPAWPTPDTLGHKDGFRMQLATSQSVPLTTDRFGNWIGTDSDQLEFDASGMFGFVRRVGSNRVNLIGPAE